MRPLVGEYDRWLFLTYLINILYMYCNYIVINLLGEPSKWSSNRMIPGFVAEVVRVTRYNQSEKSVIWRGICRWG